MFRKGQTPFPASVFAWGQYIVEDKHPPDFKIRRVFCYLSGRFGLFFEYCFARQPIRAGWLENRLLTLNFPASTIKLVHLTDVMKLVKHTPKKALKALLKQKPLRSEIDVFKTNLIGLLDKISVINKRPKDESEEHLKNDLRDFLRDTYYRDTNAINTKDKKDLVIHLGKTTESEVGVIIEAKRPTNSGEMVSADNPNKKALHELILYYLDERNQAQNHQLKQLVMTNVHEWYIVDANYFDKHIYRNTQIKRLYETKRNDRKDNPFFYEEIAKIIAKIDVEIPCVYFNLLDYEVFLRNDNKEDDRALIALFKILSPQHLLKITAANDSNSLNEKFYRELLHIIGLEEAKENGKNIIRRKKENRNAASLIEATIEALDTEDVLHRLPDQSIYGESKTERIFNVSLELGITWINRILFLKLLEGQLITYHQGNKDYRFLNTGTINDFDELFKLFHKVLAVNLNDRNEAIKTKYSRVPYLNSSLFEISELEDQTIKINSLDNGGQLELIGTTILKETKKNSTSLPTLDYLFRFLDAYDFASEGTEDVQEDNKTIINASVLGKVFEKINGYKDGSIFTPAFITMYMCRQSIRLAVVERFNARKNWNAEKFEDLYNKINDKKEANEIINSLKICDPAVGSGHFLVSALNEIIAIKSELGILMDANGKTLRDYEIEVIEDELIVTDENAGIFAYNFKSKESNRIQKTLFHEKQTIIENCLFGVDINPNSVKICRLRLWIELLKNAYYKEETNYTELETLPNIDINIKCGNSLLSRFALDADLGKALKSIKYDVKAYRGFVNDYKNEKSREVKRGLQKIIDTIKTDFRTEIGKNDPKQVKLSKLSGELFTLLNQGRIFEQTAKEKKTQKEKQAKLEADMTKLSNEIEEIKSNAIYKNAFEWRFEFPEVLNNDGEFEGFDVVIGNPPYIRQEELGTFKNHLQEKYKIFTAGGDIFSYFYELSCSVLKSNGILSFINNIFDKTTAGKALREFASSNLNFKKYIDFTGVVVFDEATTYPIILIAEKKAKMETFKYFKYSKETFSDKELLYDESVFTDIEQNTLNHSAWNFINDAERNIFIKIGKYRTLVKIYGKCYYGIKTGLNEAFITEKDLGDSKVLRPVYDGKDLKKWTTPSPFKKIIVLKSKSTKKLLGNFDWDENVAFLKMQKEEPQIMKHLQPFAEAAKKRYDKGYYWWELRNCAYYDLFEKPKIIFPNLQNTNKFAFDTTGVYLNAPAVFLPTDDKYLLAVLNSKVVWHFLKSICVIRSGGYIEVKPQYFEQIPIPEISQEKQRPFITLVDQILEAKRQGQDSTELEKQVDRLVYNLYDLTDDEITLVEGK